MYKLAIAAAAAVMALTGSSATAQMRDTHTTTTMQSPMGTTTHALGVCEEGSA